MTADAMREYDSYAQSIGHPSARRLEATVSLVDLRDASVDPVLRETLTAVGWSEAREVDISRWSEWYECEGYDPDRRTQDILRSFGGLEICPPDDRRALFWSGLIQFDPSVAATGEATRIHLRESQLGESLWPIGEWCETYVLLSGSSGSIYAEAPGDGFGVLLLGHDFSEALRTLVIRDRDAVQVVP